MVAEAAVIEIWSGILDKRGFDDSYYKRHGWVRILESRDKRSCSTMMLWHLCATKPNNLIEGFGFKSMANGLPGCYVAPAREWMVRIVAIGELPRTRDTILLRLLGNHRVRTQAIRDLDALPEGAWEKQLAGQWLMRIYSELPDPVTLAGGEREFTMDIREWHAEYMRNVKAQFRLELEPQIKLELAPQIKRELEPQIKRELATEIARTREDAQLDGEVKTLVRMFERRLARSLTGVERDVLRTRVRDRGVDHVSDVVLDLTVQDLGTWLEQDDREITD
jgi:hypothetical protein